MLMEKERQDIVDTCLFMLREGLVVGTAGNVSVRKDDLVAISPSGVPYEEMTAEDVVVFNIEGERVDGILEPSSELPLHLSVYQSTDALAITHNHAPASTALGLVVDEIPTSHYYSAMFGGQIRVAPYAEFGSDQLAENVTSALKDRTGALMKNHGAITIGATVQKAVSMLPILEYVCDVQLRAMATGAEIALLDDSQMSDAKQAMSGYGKQPAREQK
jgi:L-fuculose-phosphate aldolase